MSDSTELWFVDSNTGLSVCLYSPLGFAFAEDALFAAMRDGDPNRPDEFIVWVLKKLWILTNDDYPGDYGMSSIPGRCVNQYHIDFKQKLIKQVTMNYQGLDLIQQTTINKIWTFQDFYNTHRNTTFNNNSLPSSNSLVF